MQIRSLKIKNFRQFGPDETTIPFRKGLNVLVGENDAGKSTIIDALRYAMGTTDLHWIHVTPEDVYEENLDNTIQIQICFTNLTRNEQALLLEYLTYESDEPVVYLNWSCKYNLSFTPPRPIFEATSGKTSDGMVFSSEARELLRTTYLKPLRDAYMDMQSGRGSRLAQVVRQLPGLQDGEDNYHEGNNTLSDLSLIGIFNLTNQLLSKYSPLVDANEKMSSILHETMLLNGEQIKTKFAIESSQASDDQKILNLLEKIGLAVDHGSDGTYGLPGLGTSNIMSMACELLLRHAREAGASREESQFTLIEEPEAHIHPQRQMKLIKSLEIEAQKNSLQIVVTTHSPLLASVVDLENLIIVKHGKVYPMGKDYTKLRAEDYLFLQRYLDATKANLFFARGVIIVEGAGEELFLPSLARLLERDLTEYGISIVNVRSKGLIRYANIFKRSDRQTFDVPVACLTDRDVEPNCAPVILKQADSEQIAKKQYPENKRWHIEQELIDKPELRDQIEQRVDAMSEQSVEAWHSDQWTLEYDLAFYGWKNSIMLSVLEAALLELVGLDKYSEYEHNRDKQTTTAGKATCYYAALKTRKAEYAQCLATHMEEKFDKFIPSEIVATLNLKSGIIVDLAEILPPYLIASLGYVTGKEIDHVQYYFPNN